MTWKEHISAAERLLGVIPSDKDIARANAHIAIAAEIRKGHASGFDRFNREAPWSAPEVTP